MPRRPRPETVVRWVGALLSGLALALAFPPYDVTWLMPVGLAGLMVVVRRLDGGFWAGLVFGLGFMVPLLRWLTIIGIDAWLVLSLLEALFLGLLALVWAVPPGARWWPVAFAVTWAAVECLRGVIPFGGFPWGTLAFGLVDTTVVRYGRLGGTVLVSLVVVLTVAVVVDLVERRDRSILGIALGAAAAALILASAALPAATAGPVDSARVAAVQGNVPGEGMDPFAERRAVLHNHATATRDFAALVEAGERPSDPTSSSGRRTRPTSTRTSTRAPTTRSTRR